MKNRSIVVAESFFLSLCLALCLAPAQAAPATARGTPQNPWKIGMSQCNLGEPWRVQMNKDVKDAAAQHPELDVIFIDAQNDSRRQQTDVETLLARGIDLLIISPKEAAPLTAPVAAAYKKGIPVIVLDRKVLGEEYTCFIGADNIKIGRAAGDWIVKATGGKCTIVELKGLMTSTPGQERHKGFMEAIQGHPDVKVVFDADCKWLEPEARKEMESALSRFPAIDVVYAHNDPAAHGAYLAAKAEGKGREKVIKFVGIDALPHEGVAYVKDGVMNATFQYPTGGAEAIDMALKILKGQKVPKNVTLGTRYFDDANIQSGGQAIE